MATRAVYTFCGFPGAPQQHFYLHHDGYPNGAAWRLASALRHSREPAYFLSSFLSTQPRALPLTQPEQAADAEYRYGVQLASGAEPSLLVQCWRRLPGGTSWHCRCGPMTLAAFIRRFLPGESLPETDCLPITPPAPPRGGAGGRR